jgi:hypothetical protein
MSNYVVVRGSGRTDVPDPGSAGRSRSLPKAASTSTPAAMRPKPLRWWQAYALARTGVRDGQRSLPDVVSPGPCVTPAVERLLCEAGEALAYERSHATRAVAGLIAEAAGLEGHLRRAHMDLAAAEQDLDEGRYAQVDLSMRRPGEQHLADTDVADRRRADNLRLRDQAVAERDRIAAVAADLLGRRERAHAEIKFRVRMAQAAGIASHQKTLRKISIYAEGVVRAHPQGATLIQAGWPQLPPPPMWLHDHAEAIAMICGNGWSSDRAVEETGDGQA